MATKREKRRERISAKTTAEKRGRSEYSPFNLPEGVKNFQVRTGKHRLDVVVFKAGKNNLYASKPGVLHWESTFYVHKQIGVNKSLVVCPRKMGKGKCAICELHEKMRANPDSDKKEVDALAPKRRIALLVIDHDKPEDGLQVLEQPYFKSFGEKLDNMMKLADPDEDIQYFADPEDGMTMKIGVIDDTFMGKTFPKIETIGFVKRKEPISEEMLEAAPALDECLAIPDYKTTVALLHGDEDEDEEDDEDDDTDIDDDEDDDSPPPKSRAKSKPKTTKGSRNDDDEDDDDSDEDDDEPVKQRKTSGKTARDDDEDDEDLDESDDEDDVPAPKTKSKSKTKSKVADDDDDDDDDDSKPVKSKSKTKAKVEVEDDDEWDDDDEPAPKAKSKTSKTSKPASKKVEDDDDDDDWDDEPAPKTKAKSKTKAKVEDEDDEDEAPVKKSKTASSKTSSKGSKKVKPADDWDDDEEVPF